MLGYRGRSAQVIMEDRLGHRCGHKLCKVYVELARRDGHFEDL